MLDLIIIAIQYLSGMLVGEDDSLSIDTITFSSVKVSLLFTQQYVTPSKNKEQICRAMWRLQHHAWQR